MALFSNLFSIELSKFDTESKAVHIYSKIVNSIKQTLSGLHIVNIIL